MNIFWSRVNKIYYMKSYLIILISFFFYFSGISQNPSYKIEIKNDNHISPTQFVFDIFITNTSNTPIWENSFQLQGIQLGIKINSNILNGGTITPSIISGFSDMSPANQPTSANLSMQGSTTSGNYGLKMTVKAATYGNGTLITTNAKRICRIMLTNSSPFNLAEKMNFTWNFSRVPWQTKVSAFLPLATDITSFGEFLYPKNLNLSLILEGLYNGYNMVSSSDNNGYKWGTNIADIINIELHNASNPSTIEYSKSFQILGNNGLCSVDLPQTIKDSFYIVIKHRNSLETWSKVPISFNSNIINYNFSESQSSAFGDNLKQVDVSVFAIFAGDVNQDGLVDGSDMSDIELDNNNFISGYAITDINGDGIVDGSDISIVETNNNNFIGVIKPY